MAPLAVALTTAPVVVAIAALVIVALAAIWLVPRFQARRWRAQGVEPQQVAELENGARGTLVQIFGGVALILTFVATWVQIADTREASEQTLELTQSQQQSERYTTAVAQLGSPRLEIRLGGIYALQQVARESPRLQQPVAELMMAYLKRNHSVRQRNRKRFARVRLFNEAANAGVVVATACDTRLVRPEPDAQAAMSALYAVPRDARGAFDLSGVDLAGIRLVDPDFSGVEMREAWLVEADLLGADFEDARLDGSDFRRTCLRGADMSRAHLHEGPAGGADLRGADLSEFTSEGYPSWLDGALTDDCRHVPRRSAAGRQCRREP